MRSESAWSGFARLTPDTPERSELGDGVKSSLRRARDLTLKAVRYVAQSRTIVRRTKIAGELTDLLKKLKTPIPKQLLAVAEVTEPPPPHRHTPGIHPP